MSQRSWRMGGGSMSVAMDADRGRGVGSQTRLSGRALGLHLEVETRVLAYDPPRRKIWQTGGEPRLLVIGRYRMGFEIEPVAAGSSLQVAIEYQRPAGRLSRVLAAIAGDMYARWCTDSIARDAVRRFERIPAEAA